MNLKTLIGSGEQIGKLTLPFLLIGIILNLLYPSFFSVGGPPANLKIISFVVLVPGIINWLWSVFLIITKVPKKLLITSGPYSLVKHPLYTGVALLVIPWVGFLLNSWIGVPLGIIIYIASKKFAPEEEKILSKIFGSKWDEYSRQVKFPRV